MNAEVLWVVILRSAEVSLPR